MFTTQLTDIRLNQYETLRLKANVKCDTVPRVEWLKDGRRLSPDFEQTYEDGVCLLVLERATVQESGVYTCRAENHVGRAEVKCKVEVVGKLRERYASLLRNVSNDSFFSRNITH